VPALLIVEAKPKDCGGGGTAGGRGRDGGGKRQRRRLRSVVFTTS